MGEQVQRFQDEKVYPQYKAIHEYLGKVADGEKPILETLIELMEQLGEGLYDSACELNWKNLSFTWRQDWTNTREMDFNTEAAIKMKVRG